jgi:hypothetical protein
MEDLITKIKATFSFMRDSIFENRTTQKSIYINMESVGYKHEWSGREFKNKAGKEIRHFEIKHDLIKSTKEETLTCLIEKIEAEYEKNRIALMEATKRRKTIDNN